MANYARPAFGGSLWKDEPKIVEKVKKRNTVKRMDRLEKEAVRARDKESCRVCGKKTRDVHEKFFKSLGGVASLVNSMCACRRCHPFLQEHGITPIGPDCNHRLKFQMTEAVARMIFGARATPKHVEIVQTVSKKERSA
jgi:hypothetical protein